MVGNNTVQGVGAKRFLLTTIEAQFLMEKLCLARRFHESPAATTDMAVLPGVLGCSFDRLRTSSSCDVPFGYASEPTPCGCQVARPPRLARMAGRHAHLRRLATVIHEISGLKISALLIQRGSIYE